MKEAWAEAAAHSKLSILKDFTDIQHVHLAVWCH